MTQSQLGTVNSTLAVNMALGVPAGPASPLDQFITDTMNLVSTAIGLKEAETVNQALGISQSVGVIADRSLSVSQNLGIIDQARRVIDLSVNDTISFLSEYDQFNYIEDRNPVEQTLNLTDQVQTLSGIGASSTLNFTQSVTVQAPIYLSINQYMGIASGTSTPHRRWVEDPITFVSRARVPIDLSVSQTINFVHESPIGRVDDQITFTQNVTVGKAYDASSTLVLTHSWTIQGNFIRIVTQNLGIGHSLTWFEDTPCARKQYTPFQGDNTTSSGTTAPPESLQDAQGSLLDRFALYQPAIGTRTSEVVLRAPELDNRDRNAYTRVQGETRGGKLRVYADPIWPKVRTLAVTIVGLLETEIDNLQTFLQNTLGQEIGLTDWEGRLWVGTITTPDEVATQDGKGQWTVSFQFEGEILDVYQPGDRDGGGQAVTFSQTVGVVKV